MALEVAKSSEDICTPMKTFLEIIKDKGFWSGALQIALGIYMAICALILTMMFLSQFLPFIGLD